MSRLLPVRTARHMLLVPVLAIGLASAVTPASADPGTSNGNASGKADAPGQLKKPYGSGTGRKVR